MNDTETSILIIAQTSATRSLICFSMSNLIYNFGTNIEAYVNRNNSMLANIVENYPCMIWKYAASEQSLMIVSFFGQMYTSLMFPYPFILAVVPTTSVLTKYLYVYAEKSIFFLPALIIRISVIYWLYVARALWIVIGPSMHIFIRYIYICPYMLCIPPVSFKWGRGSLRTFIFNEDNLRLTWMMLYRSQILQM